MTIGRLTVIRYAGSNRTGRALWACNCTCGRHVAVEGKKLRSGHTISCGCFASDEARHRGEARVEHGHARAGAPTAEYRAWASMIDRCLNATSASYKNYGGRGIAVARRWRSFVQFFVDMGARPGPGFSIERRDNAKGYSKKNCYWATRRQQQRNTRRNRLLTLDGETAPLIAWAERYGLKKQTLRMRLANGWTVERSIKEPVRV